MSSMRSNRSRPFSLASPLRVFVVALIAVVSLPGCKTPDFIGNRYNNFTAYYNTFYNAERQFKSGYENLDRFSEQVDRKQYLPLFVKTTGTSASREFEQTVLKSADILREHPESKWVDDALMLIGKSYFYQENYVGAIQKFTEVIEQGTGLRDEAQFWLARSLMTSGAYDEALEVLTLAMAQEDADDQWVAQDRLLLAELAIQQELWEEAAGHLEAGLDSVKDKELAARSSFLLGQVQETLGNYPEAYRAFREVREYSAPYELDYAARYSAVRIDGLYLDADRALSEVRRLERDDKNLDKTAELRFLRARILQDIGGADEAILTYDELLYDPLALPPGASLGDLRGRIHYALGELYRDVDRNFVMAAAHFDTAAAALGGAGATRANSRSAASQDEVKAPEAIEDAALLKDSFSRYASVYGDVARYDSLLYLGELPEDEYEARILEMRRQRAEELEEQRRLLEQRQREQAFRESASQNSAVANRGLPEGKVIPTPDDPTGMAGGFLFHEDPIRVQEGRVQFQNVWGNRPLVPNWRRSAALNAADVELSDEEIAEQEAILQQLEQNELPEIDDSAVPRDSTKQATMRSDRAIARYELGNILFLGMALPDSAAVWYRTVIEEDTEQTVASRAQFALAEVQRALGDSLSAVRLYRDLLDRFPESDFIPSVQDRLGMEVTAVAITDSTAMANAAFEKAIVLRDEDTNVAVDSLLAVASDWIDYPEASRALFAISDIHLEAADGDSASIFMPIPFTLHRDRMAPIWPNLFKTQAEVDSLQAAVTAAQLAADSAAVAMNNAMEDAVSGTEHSGELTSASSDSTMAASDSVVSDSTGTAGPTGEMPAGGEESETEADSSGVNVAAADSSGVNIAAADSSGMDIAEADSSGADVAAELVEADSLNAIEDPASQPADSTSTPTEASVPVVLPVPDEVLNPVLTIEDVLSKIKSLESRSELGLRATSTLDAIVALRTPPEPKLPDSLELVTADSLRLAAMSDSLGVPVDSLKNIPGLDAAQAPAVEAEPPQAAMSDSDVLALVAQAAARRDSLAAARARNVPRAGGPVNDDRVDRTSRTLKTMLPNGQLDEEASGYTFTFGSHPDMIAAQEQYRELRLLLEETGIELYLITDTDPEEPEFLVGWGLFETAEERDEAEAEFSAILPESRNILHLLSAD